MRLPVVTLVIALLLIPSATSAFPFGGQIGIVRPCYNAAIYANLGPPRGGQFIWTPSTRTYQFGPPRRVGQWLLGLASAPYYCVVSISPVIVWAGTHIDMMGSSGAPAGPGPQQPAPTPPPSAPYSQGSYDPCNRTPPTVPDPNDPCDAFRP